MLDAEHMRLSVISFDFHQPRHTNQSRKTRFFRELYGYTQRIKRRLKDGRVIVSNYHYPGILDQQPHIKLGRSVLGVQPGTEDSIIELLQSYNEIAFYQFIGWIPKRAWLEKDDKSFLASYLITRFGFFSILVLIDKTGEKMSQTDLQSYGFDLKYIKQALSYLTEKLLLVDEANVLQLTKSGTSLIKLLSIDNDKTLNSIISMNSMK